MRKDSKIYIAGHRGLVGSSILRNLESEGYNNLITRTRLELDLLCQKDVESFFNEEQPEYVFLCAAKVGGIWANYNYPAEFIFENLTIQNNVIHSAWKTGVKGLLFLGSSCIYPKILPQPIKEEYFLSGPLEPTNEPYAVAKIAGIELCDSFNRGYGTHYLSVMPNNLYGPNDNYDLQNSHVLPALIRKFHLAKLAMQEDWEGIRKDEMIHGLIPDDIKSSIGFTNTTSSKVKPKVILWGSGNPRRELLHVNDLADACVYLMNLPRELFSGLVQTHPVKGESKMDGSCSEHFVLPLINIGTGMDLTIREIAGLVAKTVGFDGEVEWDSSKPDGTPQKLLDVSRLTNLGWQSKISLEEGLRKTCEDYQKKTSQLMQE